jgi:hypothetical protein
MFGLMLVKTHTKILQNEKINAHKAGYIEALEFVKVAMTSKSKVYLEAVTIKAPVATIKDSAFFGGFFCETEENHQKVQT